MTAAIDGASPATLHCGCFACGAGRGGGLSLAFTIGPDGAATALWQPSAAFQGYADRVHGGIIATLLDSSIVHALFARGVPGVTADLSIRYRHAVGLGEPVRVTGWVESRRLGLYLCRAEVMQSGRVSVRATAKFAAIRG